MRRPARRDCIARRKRDRQRVASKCATSSAKPAPDAPSVTYAGRARQASRVLAHVGHADRIGEMLEHRRIVRRIADKDKTLALGIDVDPEFIAQQASRHRQLVVRAEPAVDVDRAHLRRHARSAHQGHDAVDRLVRQARHVFAEVDREIAFAIRLVGCQRRAGHRAQNRLSDRDETPAIGGALSLGRGVALAEPPHGVIMAHIQRAVFADDRIDRPHAGDVIAPARGASSDRDEQQSRGAQPLHCRVRFGGDPATGRQRIVDVGEHAAHRRARRGGHGGERPHRRRAQAEPPRARRYAATARRSSALMCRPHLVRRQSTSSASIAHSCATR